MEVKTANELFEEWYPLAIEKVKKEWGVISEEIMIKHIAALAFIEGYYDGAGLEKDKK